MEVKNINLTEIAPSPMNPRKTYDEGEITDLAENIRHQGLLQPVTLRPVGDSGAAGVYTMANMNIKYEIVCGERRYRAMMLLHGEDCKKWPTIAAIVREGMSDKEAFDAMITENLQRKDVDPVEEAFAFGALIKRGDSVEEIAARFGKSIRFVQDRVKLNSLIPPLLERVKDGTMALVAAMIICKFGEEEQQRFYESYKNDKQIGRASAERFCDYVFSYIYASAWERDGDRNYQGGCWRPCSQCSSNTANAGCLFWEMKSTEDKQRCTDPEGYAKKHIAYVMDHLRHRDDVVKKGCDLELGKTVIVDTFSGYGKAAKELHETMLEELRKGGYEITDTSIFGNQCWYQEGDERLDKLFRDGEVFRCLDIFSHGWLPCVRHIYYYPKREADNTTPSAVSGSTEVIRLAQKHRRNLEDIGAKRVKKLAEKCQNMATPLELKPLLDSEKLSLDTMLVMSVSKRIATTPELVRKYNITGDLYIYERGVGSLPVDKAMRIAEDFPEDKPVWQRMSLLELFERATIGSASHRLLEEVMAEWDPEEIASLNSWCAEKAVSKNGKIAKRLAELGYDTDGVKLPKRKEPEPVAKASDLARQYAEQKRKHADSIILMRDGDFYHTFGNDATEVAEILNLTIAKGTNANGTYKTAAFPHNALESYLPKLVRAGKRVAICEQLDNPKKK